MKLSNRRIFIALLLLIGSAVSGIINAAPTNKPAATPVKTEQVRRHNIATTVQVSGTLKALLQTRLASEIDGQVINRLADAGDQVSSGQLLLQLRDTVTRLELDAVLAEQDYAQAGVELAAIDAQRIANLMKSQAAAQESMDAAQVRLTQSQAQLAIASAKVERLADQLHQHQITAPYAATVTARFKEVGEWVETGDTLFELFDSKRLRAELAIPQQYFSQLKAEPSHAGNAVDLNVAGRHFQGHINQRISQADPVSRTFIIGVDIDNPDGTLIPGMSVQATLSLSDNSNTSWIVPRDALVRHNNGEVVIWRIKPSANEDQQAAPQTAGVEKLLVSVGPAEDNWIVIASPDIMTGDRVVIRGNETLRPGQIVQPTE